MRKIALLVIVATSLIFATNVAARDSINFGSVKCTVSTLSDCRTKTVSFNVGVVDEYEVTGNAVLVSATQTSATVALYSSGDKKVSGSLLVKNSGVVLTSFAFSGVGN